MSANFSFSEGLSFDDFKKQVLEDYKLAVISRECSLLGRREVLTGKANFGIFGDGKELPQLAMARAFQKGDFRSGYYRDQTFMLAIGEFSIKNFFAGIYAHADIKAEPTSAGRQMGGHFATHSLNEDGSWRNLTAQKNSSSDISPTAGQMPRLVGLAQASKLYRHLNIPNSEKFSVSGNEIAWGTIGNASTSEGHFFEALNAAGVLGIPMVVSVWDDSYGISVPAKHHTTKENISEILKGFQRENGSNGYEILTAKGWDYPSLLETYLKASEIARKEHTPVLIHITELTQPQGHSTSGSHERYKSSERLQWEQTYDCNAQMRKWILELGFISEEEIQAIEQDAKKQVKDGKDRAWMEYQSPIKNAKRELINLLYEVEKISMNSLEISHLKDNLAEIETPHYKDVMITSQKALRLALYDEAPAVDNLRRWILTNKKALQQKYSSFLYSQSRENTLSIKEVAPTYNNAQEVDGRIVLRENFDKIFEKYPNTLIFGEDVGRIGDVNQGLEGLQEKYGELRISDTGIREATIIGQGIGLAMRGLRPIAEIQYLDYILYGLQTLSDDLATLHYRTCGKQKAPLIVRTRGHRLEGVWHSGSPMAGLLGLLRGMYILTPRNMTKAAGFYNTLLKSDQPALVIECLNGYRLKEKLPSNLGEFTTPIGEVETIKIGSDITILSYGSTLRVVEQAANDLMKFDIDVEIIDAQSLLPFDIKGDVVKSIEKTNRLLIVDEDVPGGASAYLMQQVLENQDAYKFLDSKPQTLTAKEHRPAYAADGDYFSKPNAEDIFLKVYEIMQEANPIKYPNLF